jgi:hypothetical protein
MNGVSVRNSISILLFHCRDYLCGTLQLNIRIRVNRVGTLRSASICYLLQRLATCTYKVRSPGYYSMLLSASHDNVMHI